MVVFKSDTVGCNNQIFNTQIYPYLFFSGLNRGMYHFAENRYEEFSCRRFAYRAMFYNSFYFPVLNQLYPVFEFWKIQLTISYSYKLRNGKPVLFSLAFKSGKLGISTTEIHKGGN